MKCCGTLRPVICSLLLALAGCDYGDSNKDPVATPDVAITAREVPVTVKVLANDSDPDGDQLEVVGVTQGANGEVNLNDDGTVTYTPAEGFDGTDSFTYTIDDDHGGQGTGTVAVTVLPNAGVVVNGTLYIVQNNFPGGVLAAWGINDGLQIAGSLEAEDGSELPVFIDTDGSLTLIELPSPTTLGRAFGINNTGLVSGFFSQPIEHETPEPANAEKPKENGTPRDDGNGEETVRLSFLWDANSRSLNTLYESPDAISTSGFKVNDAGIAVGQAQGEKNTVSFIRQPDGSLATFAVPNAVNTFLGGINNSNMIVGGFAVDTSAEGLLFGFIRDSSGAFATFNVPDDNGNPLWTKADDINDAGDIVGHVRPQASEEAIQGFLRKADGQFFRINIPDAVQSRFTDINNLGEISGFTLDEESVFHPVILTPITASPNTFFEDAE